VYAVNAVAFYQRYRQKGIKPLAGVETYVAQILPLGTILYRPFQRVQRTCPM
jgi:hypothetical protein